MESHRKRRGSGKGKLTLFCGAPKPPSANTAQYSSKTRPSQSVGYVVHQSLLLAQPKHLLSFVAIDASRDSLARLDNPYGVTVDDKIDSKAASYISSVQERFQLELGSLERMKCYPQEVK